MTAEQTTIISIPPVVPEQAAWEAASYIQFGVEGVPYSAIRIPLSNDPKQGAAWIGLALRAAKYLAEQYAETFRRPVPSGRQERSQEATQPREAPRAAGTGVWCPEHKAECFKTKPEYDKDGDRWYHPQAGLPDLPDGRHVKNCNLYWRQTVDADGESNQGKEMPQVQRQRVAAGRNDRDYEGDIDPDELPF